MTDARRHSSAFRRTRASADLQNLGAETRRRKQAQREWTHSHSVALDDAEVAAPVGASANGLRNEHRQLLRRRRDHAQEDHTGARPDAARVDEFTEILVERE